MMSTWSEMFAPARRAGSEKVFEGEPATRYCIAFTPRSGSTWLGDVLTQSAMLGIPKEWFNTGAAAVTIRQSGCADIEQYYRFLKARRSRRGVFGLELTWPQFRGVVEESGNRHFLDDIPNWFYLRRRDYVAQAVSLFKAIRSGVYHSTGGDRRADEVTYDGKEIDNLVTRIMRQERAWKTLFDELGSPPRNLWYEEIIQIPLEELLHEFCGQLGIEVSGQPTHSRQITPTFQKRGDRASASMCERYRQEYAHTVAKWEAHRNE